METPPPVRAGIEAFDMLVVEFVQGLPGGDGPGHEDEVQAVHLSPVFPEGTVLLKILPHRGAVKGRELGHVHVVQAEGHDEIAGAADGGLGFPGQTHYEKTLGPQPVGLDAANSVPDRLRMHAGFVAVHQLRVAGFDAQGHLQAAGGLEHPQQVVVGVAHPHRAVELYSQGPVAQQSAQFGDAAAVGGKQIVVNIDVDKTHSLIISL